MGTLRCLGIDEATLQEVIFRRDRDPLAGRAAALPILPRRMRHADPPSRRAALLRGGAGAPSPPFHCALQVFTSNEGSSSVLLASWGALGETWPYFRPNWTKLEALRQERGADKVAGALGEGIKAQQLRTACHLSSVPPLCP